MRYQAIWIITDLQLWSPCHECFGKPELFVGCTTTLEMIFHSLVPLWSMVLWMWRPVLRNNTQLLYIRIHCVIRISWWKRLPKYRFKFANECIKQQLCPGLLLSRKIDSILDWLAFTVCEQIAHESTLWRKNKNGSNTVQAKATASTGLHITFEQDSPLCNFTGRGY